MIQVLKPYSFHQPTENSPYPQNVLVRQYNFPNLYSKEDYLFLIYTEGWSDDEFMKFWSIPEFKPERNELSEKQLQKFLPDLQISQLDQQLEELTEEQFFSLGKFTATELGYDRQSHGVELTGFRVVRYTDKSTGFPYHRFDHYFTEVPEQRRLFSGYNGDNVTMWHLNLLY